MYITVNFDIIIMTIPLMFNTLLLYNKPFMFGGPGISVILFLSMVVNV